METGTPSALQEQHIAPTAYIPFDEQPDNTSKTRLQNYYDEIQNDGKYLMGTAKGQSGTGIVLYDPAQSLGSLVKGFVGQYTNSEETLIPPTHPTRTIQDWGNPIIRMFPKAALRGQVWTAAEVVDNSKAFEDEDRLNLYRGLYEWRTAPRVLGLLDIEAMKVTDWTTTALGNLMEIRAEWGLPTILTTRLKYAAIERLFGDRTTSIIRDNFLLPEEWA